MNIVASFVRQLLSFYHALGWSQLLHIKSGLLFAAFYKWFLRSVISCWGEKAASGYEEFNRETQNANLLSYSTILSQFMVEQFQESASR